MTDCRWVCHEDGWMCRVTRANGYVVLEWDWEMPCGDALVVMQECGADVDEIYPEWPAGLGWCPSEEEAKAACRKLADEYLSQERA